MCKIDISKTQWEIGNEYGQYYDLDEYTYKYENIHTSILRDEEEFFHSIEEDEYMYDIYKNHEFYAQCFDKKVIMDGIMHILPIFTIPIFTTAYYVKLYNRLYNKLHRITE